jgi:Zn-dependent membrane protease YugP
VLLRHIWEHARGGGHSFGALERSIEESSMIGFDPTYFLFLLPGMLLAMWAQARISAAYTEGSRIAARSGLSGAEAAARVMAAGDVSGVAIEPVSGELTDHYDPRSKVLRLSEGVYAGRSLAALGVAAHEAGHAIQDALGYPGLVVRNLIVPVAGIGSSLFWILIVVGLLLHMFQLILLGIALFSFTVIFQLINLPVEFDASRRARAALLAIGLVDADEDRVVAKVLGAAAWTYVAATLTSVLTLLYYLYRFGALGHRDRED